MTRDELGKLLHTLMWALDDAGHRVAAWQYEDAYGMVCQGHSDENLAKFADYVLAPGKRGRVQLVLDPPYEARAKAVLACLLKNFRSF